jgi:hypothetical protein
LNKDTWKTVELVVIAKKGKSHQVARSSLQKFGDNPKNISTSIDSKHRVIASFVYKHLQELYDILQDIKSIPHVIEDLKEYIDRNYTKET